MISSAASKYPNVHLISTAAIGARLGWADTHSMRSYQRFLAPYTPAFLDEFADEIYLRTRAFGGYYKKALILDCDGTLWGGILGDDGVAGIKLDPFSYPGRAYWRIQHEIKALQQGGVLLCIASKNDGADVDDVLRAHPEMVLRNEDFVARRVDWDDKVPNIQSLAAELGIGLEFMSISTTHRSSAETSGARLARGDDHSGPGRSR